MTILICDNELHAEVVDSLIASYIRDKDGNPCGAWSGIYTDGDRCGILWDSVCAEVLGDPEAEGLPLVEAADGEWTVMLPEASPEEAL
jgi:hypothetical protein